MVFGTRQLLFDESSADYLGDGDSLGGGQGSVRHGCVK